MVGIHAEWKIKPGKIPEFLAWKEMEGDVQRRAPGFVQRTLMQSRTDPNTFHYIAIWDASEHLESFARSEIFAAAKEKSPLKPEDHEVIITRTDVHFVLGPEGAAVA